MFSFIADPFADLEFLLDMMEGVAEGGEKLKTLLYVSMARAGKLSARAALCKRGESVEEKLYGTDALSMGWTCEVKIFTFSSVS
jgi:hypothetical protein